MYSFAVILCYVYVNESDVFYKVKLDMSVNNNANVILANKNSVYSSSQNVTNPQQCCVQSHAIPYNNVARSQHNLPQAPTSAVSSSMPAYEPLPSKLKLVPSTHGSQMTIAESCSRPNNYNGGAGSHYAVLTASPTPSASKNFASNSSGIISSRPSVNAPSPSPYTSATALKPVNGQTYYSGQVYYEPPPIYLGNVGVKPLLNVSKDSWDCNNAHGNLDSSMHSDVVIKPHSLANLKLHTYENVESYPNGAPLSKQTPDKQLVNSNYGSRNNIAAPLGRRTPTNLSRTSSYVTSNPDIFKSHCLSLNSSTINLNDQLPPRIEQDLEGRQFVIPRNNAYVQENARQSWSGVSDPMRRCSVYCDHAQCRQLGQLCYSPHSAQHTPSIDSPSPTFAPPPPYPGKLRGSLDLNDSVLSLGSLRGASGVLASVNANHNYANIDIPKYSSQQQSNLDKSKPASNINFEALAITKGPPPPPPYPSSAVRKAQTDLSNHSLNAQFGQMKLSGRESPASSVSSSKSSQSKPAPLAPSDEPQPASHPDNKLTPPPPPPYPSSLVRSQKPVLPPYPSSAVRAPVGQSPAYSQANPHIKTSIESSNITECSPKVDSSSQNMSHWKGKMEPSFQASDSNKPLPNGSSKETDVVDNGSASMDKSKAKNSGKSLLPYNVTAKTMVSTMLHIHCIKFLLNCNQSDFCTF